MFEPVSLLNALWDPSQSGCFLDFQHLQTAAFFPVVTSWLAFIGIALSALSGSSVMDAGRVTVLEQTARERESSEFMERAGDATKAFIMKAHLKLAQ
jgi:hypothetical protein